MIELGKVQELEIVRTKEFGVYLSEKQEMRQQSFFRRNRFPRERRSEIRWRFLYTRIPRIA